MTITKLPTSTKLIPILCFDICHLDGLTRSEICKLYKKSEVTTHPTCYYLEKFSHHLTVLGTTLKDYCEQYVIDSWPVCPINGKKVGYKISGKGLQISTYNATVNKEFSEKVRNHAEQMSQDRRGERNPMFGKTPWNEGLDKSDPRVLSAAQKRLGTQASEETKLKQRKARESHPLKARHTTKHSEETKIRLREATAQGWAEGRFNRVSSIHLKMREFLQSLNLEFVEEYQVKYFSLDFSFPDAKVGIECQGGFFHVDPRLYPNGPICAIQRRNFGRDKAKRKVVGEQEGWKVIEIWETEINDGTFRDFLIKQLQQYNII